MARNALESDFRSSKMVAGSHFVKKKKLSIDVKWREMRSKGIFGHPKWPPAAILQTKLSIVVKWREMRSKVIFYLGSYSLRTYSVSGIGEEGVGVGV